MSYNTKSYKLVTWNVLQSFGPFHRRKSMEKYTFLVKKKNVSSYIYQHGYDSYIKH